MISMTKLTNSFHYAFSGLQFAWENDQNIRLHFVITLLVLVLAFSFQVTAVEFGILLAMIVIVLFCEMINTTVEKVVDLITKETREDARIAKDVSSAMVLIASVGAAIVGLSILLPYFFRLF